MDCKQVAGDLDFVGAGLVAIASGAYGLLFSCVSVAFSLEGPLRPDGTAKALDFLFNGSLVPE